VRGLAGFVAWDAACGQWGRAPSAARLTDFLTLELKKLNKGSFAATAVLCLPIPPSAPISAWLGWKDANLADGFSLSLACCGAGTPELDLRLGSGRWDASFVVFVAPNHRAEEVASGLPRLAAKSLFSS